MDALCPRRGSDSNQATERVVNQLLTELDGMHSRSQVLLTYYWLTVDLPLT